MPSRLDSPVLSLSINNISKIDTHNVDNLFGMWTIFSRCAESLENGRRLENLSWRLWNQETFYTGTDSKFKATLSTTDVSESSSTRSRSSTSSIESVPSLSCSAGSDSSNERYTTSSVHSNQSTFSRRGSSRRERHINPVGLAKLMSELNKNEVEHIIEEHARSPAKQPAKPIAVPVAPAVPKATPENSKASTTSSTSDNSTGSHSSVKSSHSVVRGFGPGLISHSLRSSTKLVPDVSIKETFQTTQKPIPPKKGGMFIVGSDQSDASGSYAESAFGNSLRQVTSGSSKRATFEDKVQTRTIFNEDDDEDEYITEDESAIDDEDLEWDSVSEDGDASDTEDNMFARIEEPRPTIVSRRSLLSTLLHQDDRAAAIARAGTRSAPAIRSRTASPNGPSVPPSPIREAPVSQIGGALAVPMTRNTSTYPLALSPRTTRRNMLATELTESLRKHLLWERQQKNKVANAVLKRRHTAYDMQNMTTYPQQQDRAGSWNNHFEHGVNEYHLAGW